MVLFYRIKYIKNPNLNKIDEIATIRNQHLAIYSLLILQDGRLATGSDDFLIKIFNLENLECEQTLKGHMDGIICLALQFDFKRIFSITYKNMANNAFFIFL